MYQSRPQLRANGAFREVSHPVAGTFETVAAPFNVHTPGVDIHPRGPGPEVRAASTTLVLLWSYPSTASVLP